MARVNRASFPGVERRRRRSRRAKLKIERLEDRAVPAVSMAPNELLVQYLPILSSAARVGARGAVGAALVEELDSGADGMTIERIRLPFGVNLADAARRISALPGVMYAEPNFIHTPAVVSNDPYYTTSSLLWGMYSDDSPTTVGPAGTTNQFGSQAEEAWYDENFGSQSVVVGVIDEGIQYTHPDLDANIWTNPFDPLDGVDNDGNGYVDDIHGWDFFSNNNSIYDGTSDDHGTHVAGTIGAEGGNGAGVAGVNWNVTMISAKFLGPSGGYTSDAVEALDYLVDLKQRHGINIVATNNSWGGGGYSASLHSAIIRAAKAGILFVAAAGNAGANNDVGGSYPANYNTTVGTATETAASYDAVISVASINSNGSRSSFSSYGATTVDLGAPGAGIYSTVPSNSYASYSGTSMATPHVTGAAALYAAKYPGATAEQIRSAILASAAPTASLAGITVTGGRLDVHAALQIAPGLSMSINNVSQSEGDSGAGTFNFTVSLSSAPTGLVTVDFVTADGTAAVADADYVATGGTLTFNVGETSKTVSVTVIGDTAVESNEAFFVNLSNANGATITDGQGTGTINNDDNPPASLSINNISFKEGHRGSKSVKFTVTLSQALAQTVTVAYATANGTATAGSDYAAKSGTLTFSAGATAATIWITVYGDRTAEAYETFFVNLFNASGASIADGQGQGTIRNDDGSSSAGGASSFHGGSASSLLSQFLNSSQGMLLDDFGSRLRPSLLAVEVRNRMRVAG